ncbi:hypothetical protein HN51_009555 [Arachis hypogaea]
MDVITSSMDAEVLHELRLSGFGGRPIIMASIGIHIALSLIRHEKRKSGKPMVLVNQNKAVLILKKSKSNCHAVCDSELEFGVQPAYSKKAATRNIKSLVSCARQLLSILSDLFITSQPEMYFSLKGATGCLASITDSSVTKEMFLSFLDKFMLRVAVEVR